MDFIIPITGEVKFPITLDASIWIFDDRKIDKEEFINLDGQKVEEYFIEKAESQMGLREGLVRPPVNKSIKRFERDKILKGSFLMPLKPFIETSEPKATASKVHFVSQNDEVYKVSLEDAREGLFYFAENGKPLRENGPVHFVFGDGRNLEHPFTHINKIVIE